MREWILSELNYGHVRDQTYEIAVLPMGATEPHNLHLPYGTDTLEADAIGSRVCEAGSPHGINQGSRSVGKVLGKHGWRGI